LLIFIVTATKAAEAGSRTQKEMDQR
jgi:hypothetical protein